MSDGKVNIRGKEYLTVAYRVNKLRQDFDHEYSIVTEIVQNDNDVVIVKAVIANAQGRVIATGYAEEIRGSTNINKTSALENCETSAIGRALAALGYTGTEYASADEVQQAISQQNLSESSEKHFKYCESVRENMSSIIAIKDSIAAGDYSAAAESWFELSHDVKKYLWVAHSKGGMFTAEERRVIKEDLRKIHFEEAKEKEA